MHYEPYKPLACHIDPSFALPTAHNCHSQSDSLKFNSYYLTLGFAEVILIIGEIVIHPFLALAHRMAMIVQREDSHSCSPTLPSNSPDPLKKQRVVGQ